MYVVTNAQMRELERLTIDELHVPGELLMENAGAAVARRAVELLNRAEVRAPRVLVVAGGGNNAGDGFVAARHLIDHVAGLDVALLVPQEQLRGDARANFERLAGFPVGVQACTDAAGLPLLDELLARADLVLDAVFGTGLTRAITGHLAEALERVGRGAARLLAIDLPSGVDGDTGRIHGLAPRADATVTFALPKRGHLLFPGRDLVGTLYVEPIGLPVGLAPRLGLSTVLLSDHHVLPFVGPRPRDSHKGTFGHLFVAAGSPGKAGAALLAGGAGARVGAGLVTVLTDLETRRVLEGRQPELMVDEVLSAAGLAPGFERFLAQADAWVLGCGLGVDGVRKALLARLLAESRAPLVIDADALTLLAREPDLLATRPAGAATVLTPHPGEFRRLEPEAALAGADPVALAERFAARHGVVVVLKGATTVVAGPDGRTFLNTTGSPALATAGSGDVLSGLLGGLLAADGGAHAAVEVAAAAVALHGRLGTVLEARLGQRAATAADLAALLPDVLRDFENAAAGRARGEG
jgi:NAD(P)H-hydrate epimerase